MKQEFIDKFLMDCYLDSPEEFKKELFYGGDFNEVIESFMKLTSPLLFAFIDKEIFLEKAKSFGLQDLFMITNDIYKEYANKKEHWNQLANFIYKKQKENQTPEEIIENIFTFSGQSYEDHIDDNILFYVIDYSKTEHPLTELLSKVSDEHKKKFFDSLGEYFYVEKGKNHAPAPAKRFIKLLNSENIEEYDKKLFQFLPTIKIKNHNILLASPETRKKICNPDYFKMSEIQNIYSELDLSDETKKILSSLNKLKTKSKMFTAMVLRDFGIQCEMPNKEYVLGQLDEALMTGKIDKTDYENLNAYFNVAKSHRLTMKVV